MIHFEVGEKMRFRITGRIFQITFLMVVLFLSGSTNIYSGDRPKIGLVLSGGGAKGFAHVGTLKLIDSLGIHIDYIAGTSMGGIIGALYSIGYSGEEIENIIRKIDWDRIFSDRADRERIPILEKDQDNKYQLKLEVENFSPKAPGGLVAGQEIMKIFSRYTNPVSTIDDFDKFKIPFRCVAVDLPSGKEIVLDSGYLALAMRATMSIPTVFSPVEYGDYLLIDGGISNNLPVDVARNMGAEFVIAVNVGHPQPKKEEINTVLDVTVQTMFIPGLEKETENLADAEILISPDILDYGTGDFVQNDILGIIEKGNIAADENRDKLADFAKKIGVERKDNDNSQGFSPLIIDSDLQNFKINSIEISNNKIVSTEEILTTIKIDTGLYIKNINWNKVREALDICGYFINTEFFYRKMNDSAAELKLNVVEKTKPLIKNIDVHGNQRFHKWFIRDLLSLKKGDSLDFDLIDERIDNLFSLGYFNQIFYTVEPLGGMDINLHIHIKEKSRESLNLGLKYLEKYKFITYLGFVYNSLIFDGVRAQADMEFAGWNRLTFHLSYPSMQFNNIIYPYIRLDWKRLDENHFSDEGKGVASYKVKDGTAGLGVGFLFSNSSYLETEIAMHYLNYEGTVASDDDIDTTNTVLISRYLLDELDNSMVPNKGMKVKASFYGLFAPRLLDGIPFFKWNISARIYQPLCKKLNLRISGLYADANKDNIHPIWYHKDSGPENFIGLRYNQLRYTHFASAGIKLRYEPLGDLYVSAAADFGFWLYNSYFDTEGYYQNQNLFYGIALGLSYNSIIGILNFEFGSADKNPVQAGVHEFWSTFNFGLPM